MRKRKASKDKRAARGGTAEVVQPRDELAEVFAAVAGYFHLLSDPTRLRILHAICDRERSVSTIVEATRATQTNVSRHLALLHQAGVVSRRRDGHSVLYAVADPEFASICRGVCIRIAGRYGAGAPLTRELLEFAAHGASPG